MKIKDYKPYYHCYHLESYFMIINGKKYILSEEDFWDLEEYEFDDWEIGRLDLYDIDGFTKSFKYIESERDLLNHLENSISNYADWYEGSHIDWLQYTFDWFLNNSGNFTGWQISIIEKWLVTKIEIYSKIIFLKKESPVTLEDMFVNPEKLKKIAEQLTKKSFLIEGVWKGKPDPKTGKIPREKQLAALALVIQEKKLLQKDYTDKDTAIAFLKYFNLETKGNYFKQGSFNNETDEYKCLFSFI